MQRADINLLSVAAAVIAFAATYAASPPAPKYYPLERQWRSEATAGAPSMGWYGRSAWGLGAALAAGGLTAAVTLTVRRRRAHLGQAAPLPRKLVWLVAALALAAMVALAGYVVVHEFGKWGTWGTWEVKGGGRG